MKKIINNKHKNVLFKVGTQGIAKMRSLAVVKGLVTVAKTAARPFNFGHQTNKGLRVSSTSRARALSLLGVFAKIMNQCVAGSTSRARALSQLCTGFVNTKVRQIGLTSRARLLSRFGVLANSAKGLRVSSTSRARALSLLGVFAKIMNQCVAGLTSRARALSQLCTGFVAKLGHQTSSTSRARALSLLGVLLVTVTSLVGLVLSSNNQVQAATSDTLNFQGRLLTNTGGLVPDGDYNIEFNLYNVDTAGTPLWTEDRLVTNSQGVTIRNGYFSVYLGELDAFGAIDWDQEMYLGMTVRGTSNCAWGSCTPADAEMTPRFKLSAVPYAFRAANVGSSSTNAGSTNSNGVSISTGDALGATSNSGNITIDSGTATGTAGQILLGTNNASALTLGRAGVTTTLQGSVSLTGAGTALTVTNDSLFNGNVTIGSDTADTLTVEADAIFNGSLSVSTGDVFTNAGSTLFTAISIADDADGGVLGSTAAATVDIATSLNVNQTTASQSFTLATPTTTTSGRILYINNVGSVSLTLEGNPIAAGSSASYIWNGTSWVQTISFTSTGVDTVGALDGQTPSANGATIVGTSIYLQSASATAVGLVNTSAQTFAGVKTFNSAIIAVDDLTVDTDLFFVDASANFVSVGSTSDLGAKLQVVGSANETQLLIRANSTQTLPLILTQDSTGSELFRVVAPNSSSTFIGFQAASSASGGTDNTGIGYQTLFNNTGSGNTAFGSGALVGNTSGGNNIGIGINALRQNQTGSDTVAIGRGAISNSSANDVDNGVFIGTFAGGQGVGNSGSGDNATIIGYQAGYFLDGGANNILLGYQAGDNLTTGGNNIIIGYDLNASSATVSNELRIGGVLQGNTSTLAAQFNGTLGVTTLGTADTSTYLCRNSSNIISGCLVSPISSTLADNVTDAFDLQEGTNNYININTTNTSENISFGNATTNPTYNFLGTGTLTVSGASTFNGNLTVGSAPGVGQLTVNGSTVNSTLALGNFAAGGSIGSAATTVDIYTSVSIAQTTASQTLTIPTPTASTTYGRIVQLSNVGTTSFTVLNNVLAPGTSLTAIWSNTNGGASWQTSGTAKSGGTAGTVSTSASGGASGAVASRNANGADYINTSTTSAQTVINTALSEVGASGGGTVYLLEGTYIIDGSISIPDNTTLAGSGNNTIIKFKNSTNLAIPAITNTNTTTGENIVIRDLYIDGNASNQSIVANGMNGIKIEGVGSNGQGGIITNVLVFDIYTSLATGETGASILLKSSSNFLVSNNRLQSAFESGVALYSSSSFNTIIGNTFNGNNSAIDINGSSSNIVTGNTTNNNSGWGISLSNGANGNTISSNNINTSGFTTSNEGITISTSDFNQIIGNTITDTQCTTTCYAINISNASSDKNYLEANRFTGSAANAASINDAGTGTIYAGQQTNSTTSTLSDVSDFRFRGSANSATAFAVQTAAGTSVLSVNTDTAGVTIAGTLTVSGANLTSLGGALTVTGLTTLNGGLTVEAGDTFTFNGDAFTDLTGSGLVVSSNALTVDATSATGFFRNGGNDFGGNATLGTNTAGQTLILETANTTRFTLSATASTLTGNGATTIAGGSTLALSSAAASALTVTSGTTGALTLDTGTTGAINIGTNANAKTITIGNGTGATSLVLNAGTGNINIGANNFARTINLGTGAAVVQTINIGGTGANVIGLGNTQIAGSISLGAAMTTGTISIGGTGAQTGTITLGTGTGVQTISLGTGGTGAKTVVLGSTASTSTTTIQGGSGGIVLAAATTANGTLTVGSAPGVGQLTVYGSTVNSTLALGNFAAGGSIGSAATTVDIYTSISIAQTTAAQTLTLPTPTTSTTYGRTLQISNIGTSSFTLLGNVLAPGTSLTAIWSNTNGGASWQTSGTAKTGGSARTVGTSAVGGASGAVASTNPSSADFINTSTTSAQTTINTALTAVGAAGGGTVVLMEGTYIIDGSISIPNNTTLSGAGLGTVIKFKNGINVTFNGIVNTDTTTGTKVGVQNLRIDGNKANQSGSPVTMTGIYFNGLGSSTRNGGRISGLEISNIYDTSNLYGAITLDNSSSNSVTSNSLFSNDSSGIATSGTSESNTFSGNTLNDNFYGIVVYSFGNDSINSNTTSGNSYAGIQTGGSSSVVGNTSLGDVYGILVNSSDAIITGNNVIDSTTYGIYVLGSYNNVSSNQITRSGGSTTNNGIYVQNNGNSISSNTISDTFCSTTCFAINIAGGSEKNKLSDNRFKGTFLGVSASINDAGTNTIYDGQQTNSTTGTLSDVSDFRFRGSANSTTAFAVQNASGTSVLNVNTTTAGVTIGGTLTVDTTSTFTGLATFNGGLTVETGDTFTFNGDGFTDFTGGGLVNTGGVLTVDATTATGFFRNGGNSFSGTATLGTNDNNSLVFRTNSTTALTIDGSQAATFAGTLVVSGATVTVGTASTTTGGITFLNASNPFGVTVSAANQTIGNALITIPDTAGVADTFCLATVNNCNNSNAFVNGGNSFTALAVLGTNDAYDLQLEVAGNTVATFANSNGSATFQNTTDSANAFRILSSAGGAFAGAEVLGVDTANFAVDIASTRYKTISNSTCATNCTITQANVDTNAAIIVEATDEGLDITLPDPTDTTAGRLVYITAANGSEDFTLLANVGGGLGVEQQIAMRQNTTATMIWDGSNWTAAGASSSTTLQAAYDNTLTAAGGAEIVLNNTASSNGLTVRNNATIPIIGEIFEAQTAIGSNLFSVNNNAIEYATNGGAETQGASVSTFPASTWSATPSGGTVTRYTTIGDFVATGQGSVSVVTGASANDGAANTLDTALTANLRYSVSFAVRGAIGFNTLDVVYSPDGTNTGTVACATGQTVTQGAWTRVTCFFDAPASGITSSNALFIRQSDATARTFYVENLSVTVKADVNHAADGSVDDAGSFATNWTAAPGGGTALRDTSIIYDTSGSASVTTTATVGHGIRNNMAITPTTDTQYLVTFYARSSNSFTDIRVRYSRDGGTSTVPCVDYNTQDVSTSSWTRITCLFTTDGTAPSNADLIIDQPTGVARTFYVDALSITLNTNTASNVKIGGGSLGGPTTLLTLDRSAGPPVAANNDAYLGSMYYDTITGRIQCYESGGWGTCGAPPDNIVNLNPEYAGSVLNGSGIGTMQADVCANESGVLQVNQTLCASGEARNYYVWTSPQATEQTYSIYVTYQLPSTFDGFASDDTVQLTGRVDSTTNAAVTYEMFKSQGGTLTQCGSGETNVASVADTWQTVGINGNESTGCSFNSSSANGFVLFKINLKAESNANAYVSTLTFTTTGR